MLRRAVGQVQAVSGVSFDLCPGETLGLVGESGCGKSTTGRAVLQLIRPTSGEVLYDEVNLADVSDRGMCGFRQDIQIVFQDPHASLDPRMSVSEIRTRCWLRQQMDDRGEDTSVCRDVEPPLEIRPSAGVDHPVACHFAEIRPVV